MVSWFVTAWEVFNYFSFYQGTSSFFTTFPLCSGHCFSWSFSYSYCLFSLIHFSIYSIHRYLFVSLIQSFTHALLSFFFYPIYLLYVHYRFPINLFINLFISLFWKGSINSPVIALFSKTNHFPLQRFLVCPSTILLPHSHE